MLVAPVFAALRDEVLRALDADALITHNAHVDVGVLEHKLGGWECPEVFDTLKLARRLLPDQASYQLGALVDAVKLAEGLPEGLTPHGATYDAVVAARLFVRLATRPDSRPLSLEELRGTPPPGDDDEALEIRIAGYECQARSMANQTRFTVYDITADDGPRPVGTTALRIDRYRICSAPTLAWRR